MKRGIFLFLMLIVTLSFVAAQEFDLEGIQCNDLLKYKDKIVGQTIPSEVPFSTEIFNIYIAEEIYGFLEINDSMIDDFGCYESENATYDILIESEQTLKDIFGSEDFSSAFLEKINNKEINIKGKSFGTKFKLTFVKMGLKIWSWFR